MESDRARRILVVDDTRAIHEDFRKILHGGGGRTEVDVLEASLFGGPVRTPTSMTYDVVSAYQGVEALAKVIEARAEGSPFALAFVDMRMPPGWDGVETVERLWEADPDLQIVICTAYSDYSWEEVIDRLGVSDRLLLLKKPFDTAEVSQLACALTEKWHLAQRAKLNVAQLRSMVHEQTRDLAMAVRRLEESESRFRHEAHHDSLTGLPNRQKLTERLERCIARHAEDPSFRYAIMFVDLDRFKVINDSLGHLVGDALLVALSKRLGGAVREMEVRLELASCQLVRLGGDEFVLLAEGFSVDGDVVTMAETLLASVREPVSVGEHRLHSSLSVGVAIGERSHRCVADLLRDADTALYRAKEEGRGRYSVFDAALGTTAIVRWQTENQLRSALEDGHLFVAYQPIVELASGVVDHFEALVRWRHPERGLVSPAEFIPLAEETGLVIPLGLWVIRQACEQIVLWRRDLPFARTVSVAVNVASTQLARPEFAAQVKHILDVTGAPASSLELELTESSMMDEGAVATCALLRTLGVRLHLDDFGTGYSSLAYLTRVPVDALKIDRSFISAMRESPMAASIVQTVIALARALEIDSIAEGIEHEEDVHALRRMGCSMGQGYHFGKPLPAAAATELLERHAEEAVTTTTLAPPPPSLRRAS